MSHAATVAEMEARLQALAPQQLEIMDESHLHAGHAGARSGGGHFRLLMVSAAFAGKGTVQRHRLIHETLGDLMRGPIHALSIRAQTPEEV